MKLTEHELDLIIQALEFFAAEGCGMGDLEIAEVQELANKVARYEAVEEMRMSYAAEVQTDSTGRWYGNAVRFATKTEAEVWANDRSWRWSAVRDTRVVESNEPATHQWLDGRMMPITKVQK